MTLALQNQNKQTTTSLSISSSVWTIRVLSTKTLSLFVYFKRYNNPYVFNSSWKTVLRLSKPWKNKNGGLIFPSFFAYFLGNDKKYVGRFKEDEIPPSVRLVIKKKPMNTHRFNIVFLCTLRSTLEDLWFHRRWHACFDVFSRTWNIEIIFYNQN